VRIDTGPVGFAEAQRGTLLLWMPLALGCGTGIYFALRIEPGLAFMAGVAVVALAGLALGRILPRGPAQVALALALMALGFMNAGRSAHLAGEPVLGFRYYGPVQGRIVHVDRSAGDRPRLTLDQVVLRRVASDRTPAKVRVSLGYPRQYLALEPGRRIVLTAHLSPPSGPVEPGGFDFQRYAWFRGLGAIGYTRTPVLEIAPPDPGAAGVRLGLLRLKLARGIRARIPGQTGAFAAAILTGDRSAISPRLLQNLRDSNLAHLLAISGLHMGLLTGFVFAVIRYGLALVPYLALRWPVRKIAAAGAFAAAVAYLLLSGGNVATQRAFVMAAVMLLAVVLDRRALTMRAVALAAVIVLALRPESLIEAGFQMSFAATTALVAVFALLRDREWLTGGRGFFGRAARYVLALILSSAVAGAATAPVSAYHFNQIAQFGLLANLASVPVMGMLVMPAAVLAVLATPLGLAAPFWAAMAGGIGWILFVAGQVAALDGAVFHVVKPPVGVLVAIAGGMLGLILVRGRVRLVGLIPVLAGFLIWSQTQRPALLLSSNGGLVGVMTGQGRWLNRAKGNGFVARSWLENDGDAAPQQAAAARTGPEIAGKKFRFMLGDRPVVFSRTKTPGDAAELCVGAALVIVPRLSGFSGTCAAITADELRASGAFAIDPGPDGLLLTSARQITGARLWSR